MVTPSVVATLMIHSWFGRAVFGIVTCEESVPLISVTVLPCIVFFVIFQRTLSKGIVAGSIK